MTLIKNKDSNSKSIEEKPSIHGIKTALLERFSNPIFYSFIISWSLFNWDKIAVFFLSKQNIINRIETIKTMPSNVIFFGDLFSIPHATTLIFPVISTCFLVFLSPFINNFIYWVHAKQIKNKIKNQESLIATTYTEQEKTAVARVSLEESEEIARLKKQEEKSILRAKSTEAELRIDELIAKHDELTKINSELEKSRKNLLSETSRLSDLNSELISKQEEINNSIVETRNKLEVIKKDFSDALSIENLITQKDSIINNKAHIIESYKNYCTESLSILKKTLDYINTPPNKDDKFLKDMEISDIINEHTSKYGSPEFFPSEIE